VEVGEDTMPAVVVREDQVEEEHIIIVGDPVAVLVCRDKDLQVVEDQAFQDILPAAAAVPVVLELLALGLLRLLVE
jgi:UDP-2,3-diacylglucosamine pyrophosphatase LpxH